MHYPRCRPTACLRLACLFPALAPALFWEAPVIEIDLDKPPRDRWRPAAEHFKEWYHENFAKMVVKDHNAAWDPAELQKLRRNINLSEEYMEELEGYVRALEHPRAAVDDLLDLNMAFELGYAEGFGCTSIVAPDVDGYVIHGRNMDMYATDQWFNEITYIAAFVRKGKQIARAVTYLGFVGTYTGLRLDHGYSVAANTRFTEDFRMISPIEGFSGDVFGIKVSVPEPLLQQQIRTWRTDTLTASRAKGTVSGLAVRQILLEQASFEDAVEAAAITPLLGPMYMIIGGAGRYQGAVVSKGRAESNTPGFFDISIISKGSGNWFILQTNDDRWDYHATMDPRREAGNKWMEAWSQYGAVAEQNVMDMLRKFPLCNPLTTFTWVCQPSVETERISLAGACPVAGARKIFDRTPSDRRLLGAPRPAPAFLEAGSGKS